MRLKFRVPATSANMGAGFDVFGAALKLYNNVEVNTVKTLTGKKLELKDIINIEARAGDKKDSPQSFEGIKNLIRSAVLEAVKEFKLQWRIIQSYSSVNIILTNNAPLARGLGSSASAITGAVYSAGILGGSVTPVKKLWALACRIEGHPDNITPAFFGGFCVAVDTAESGTCAQFDYLKLEIPAGLKAVLCVPDFGMSTEAARKILPLQVPFRDAVFNASRTALLVSAIVKREFRLLNVAMQDRLHQPYRKKLIPGFDDAAGAALGAGAYGVSLSGSGSTMLAVCPDNERLCKKVGKAMTDTFLRRRLGSRYIVCGFDNEGVKRIKS